MSSRPLYNQNPGLDQTNASLKGNAWFDVSHDLAVLTNFQIAHLNVGVGTLSSPANAVQPTPYNLLSGDVSVRKEFNRLTASIGFRTDSYDYGSTRAQDGTVINQDSRDGQIYTLHGRVDYAFSSVLGWFSAVEGNERDIRGTPGHTAGFAWLSGAVRHHRRVDQPDHRRIRRRICAAAIRRSDHRHRRGSFLSRHTDLAPDPPARCSLQSRTTRHGNLRYQFGGVLADAVQLGLDYELRRNVILSLAGGYETDRFFGQLRKDHVITTDSSIKYLLNRFAPFPSFIDIPPATAIFPPSPSTKIR